MARKRSGPKMTPDANAALRALASEFVRTAQVGVGLPEGEAVDAVIELVEKRMAVIEKVGPFYRLVVTDEGRRCASAILGTFDGG